MKLTLILLPTSLLSILGIVLFFSPKPPLLNTYDFSKAVYAREGHLLKITLSQDEKYRLYTPLSKISKQLVEATLLQEDRYFRWHFGVNPLSLCKAFWQTYVRRSRRVGASTITMQVARLRFGIHSKNLSGKFMQLFRALQLERYYTKDEILEAYLNLAPYGGNIEGVEAASLIYFNHQAGKLSLAEAMTLTVIPQNPMKRTPNQSALNKSRADLWTRWLLKHPKDLRQKALVTFPVLMQSRHSLFFAAHFVNMALQAKETSDPHRLSPSRSVIQTSLDFNLQMLMERVMRQYIARKKPFGVSNATALLLDTRDMGIRAFIGSLDFFDAKISGQINGVEMKRSPGSTLKPFIYGLALDQGLIHPNTVLKDVPQSFNGYNPENFDADFMGPIKAKDALTLSRNIPAVFLANQLKNPNVYQLLEQAGVTGLRAESYYGLSLHLGAVEISMRELVGLYAMLVNQGLWYPSHFLAEETKGDGRRLLSPEASFLVLDMLENTSQKVPRNSALPVAFKTGTSSGYRDAWTIGAFGPYVLAVWIGNADNQANPALVGKEMAAPLFFELLEVLQQGGGPIHALEKHPELMNLKKVTICKASGLMPTRYCLDREETWFIPGVSPIKTDNVFREVAVNKKTGLRSCHIDADTQFEIFEFWPSDLLSIFKRAGIQRHTPPLFEPGCVLTNNHDMSPQIVSPQAGVRYVLRIHNQDNQVIPLTAVTDAGIRTLYWFINERFIGKTSADKALLWHARPGRFIIHVVDDHGLSDARTLHVAVDS